MSSRFSLAVLAICLMISAAFGWSQREPAQPMPSGPIIKEQVRQVLVPVIVTDRKDRPVSGLHEINFTVFEDEVPQRIVAFSATYDPSLAVSDMPGTSKTTANASASVLLGKIGPNSPLRTYLICVDTLHSSIGDVTQARRALAKFFENEQDPHAQYALMNLSRRIDVIQDSTRDVSLVLSALASKKFQSSILDGEAANIARESEQLRAMLVGFSPQSCNSAAVRVRGTVPDNCSDMKHRVQQFVNSSAERTAVLTRTFIGELRTIVNAMASIPTERTVILISDGFNLVPGRELFGIASAYFPNEPEWRYDQRDTQAELNDILRLAQRYNVIVYGLDSRGLYTPASTGLGDASHQGDAYWTSGAAMPDMMRHEDNIAWENGSAMAQLAAATGGLFFHDSNDLSAGLRRAFNDERERYLLAYNPSNGSTDGKYRKIRVEVKGKNLQAHAKSGYWAIAN